MGWPENKEDAPALIHPFFSIQEKLNVQDGLVFKRSSVIVPKSLCAEMKMKIHLSHLGIEA